MSTSPNDLAEYESIKQQLHDLCAKEWLTTAERAQYDELMRKFVDLDRLRVAASDADVEPADTTEFVPPPTHPGEDNLPDSPPPAAPEENHPEWAPDLSKPVKDAPPVEGQTVFLPLTGNSKYDNDIRTFDKAYVELNDTAFDLNPDDVWKYDAPHLGGDSGPSTISTLKDSTDKLTDVTSKSAREFDAIQKTFDDSKGQNWTNRMATMYEPMLTAAKEGVEPGGPAAVTQGYATQAGEGASKVFDNFHASIAASRDAIAGLYSTDENGNVYLDTSKTLTIDRTQLLSAQDELSKMQNASEKLGTSIDPWVVPDRDGVIPKSEITPKIETPAPSSPSIITPSSNTPGDTSPSPEPSKDNSALKDELSKYLSQTPTTQTPTSSSPMSMPSMSSPSMPSSSQLPDMSQLNPDTQLSSDDLKDKHAAPPDAKPDAQPKAPPQTPDGTAATHAIAQNAIPKPGDAVRPGQLGADGRPLDKDGDGKMDADAVAPTKENMDPDGDGVPNNFQTMVNADGRELLVSCDDPRLAEMMQRMSEASPDSPVTIMDAADASGLSLNGYGTEVDVLGIKPGDVVTGMDRGLYLGEGNVLTEGGEVKSLSDVMDVYNSDPKVHRLELPELPSSSEVIPEVSQAPAESDTPMAANSEASAEQVSGDSAPESAAPVVEPASAVHQAPEPATAAPEVSTVAAPSEPSIPDDAAMPVEVKYEGHAIG